MIEKAAKKIVGPRQDREPKHLSLGERLGLIGLIEEGMRQGSKRSAVAPDLFANLWELVATTVSGSKIDRLKPDEAPNGFHVLEINAETGENLGRLNMLYLRKPLPCYYLVYVEVALPYRNKGLGNRILRYFRDFLLEKSALGVLDNIIPKDDPTFDVYLKHAWVSIDEILDVVPEGTEDYMLFIPPRFQDRDISRSVLKLVHHLKRRRAAIDMKDNEAMVRQTIGEFRELYAALLTYFQKELDSGHSAPLMRFMFTRFVTKLIAFRRRISDLLGYTGGESLEQITLDPRVAALPVQSYAPHDLAGPTTLELDVDGLWPHLPQALRNDPSWGIENLPNYLRPSLVAWLVKNNRSHNTGLTVGDLMDLGFDPTRLKEIVIDGQEYIFERLQARQLPELMKKQEILHYLGGLLQGAMAVKAPIQTNPPILIISNRGHTYALRRKIPGIHWEEAVEQLLTAESLKAVNATVRFDRLIQATVRQAFETVSRQLKMKEQALRDNLVAFISWNLEDNRPRVVVDMTGNFFEGVWLA